MVGATAVPQVLSSIGGFGGLFELGGDEFKEPVLVSSTDGVGTKAYLAALAKRYSSIGIDLVAMCVDDIAVLGAKPLFLLDYLSVGQLDAAIATEIVSGVANGVKQCGASLLGGEMAEHPGSMPPGHFDLAGFVVGIVEKSEIWGPHRVCAGDLVVGIDSPNLRSNGYSLARRAIFGSRCEPGASESEIKEALDIGHGPGSAESATVFDQLLEPSVLYSPVLAGVGGRVPVHAAAHITGGGLEANLARVIPDGLRARIDKGAWAVPPIFELIQARGSISDDEMSKVFNMGIGMTLVLDASVAAEVIEMLPSFGRRGYVIGEVERDA